jgi:flagellar hook protein FlgE
MGIFDALTTSVGGLQAQSFALQNISGNIANASTVGYKGIDTSFEDLIPDALTVDKQVAGGVTAHAQQTITSQGTVSSSTVATNIAINGDGFFDVQKPTGVTDNVPTFNGVTNYTRAGDFQVNAQGYLVNSAGYYLMGVNVDPKTGNPLGNVPTVLQFDNNFVPAQATTAIQYAANLPTVPVTAASANAPAGSIGAQGGLNQADFGANNPVVAGTPAQPYANASVTGNAALDGGSPAAAVTSSTLLSNLSPAITGTTGTITVDGVAINFKNAATAAPAKQGGTLTGTVDIATAAISDTTALNFTVDGKTVNLAANSGTGAGNTFAATDITTAINGTAGIDVTATVNGTGDIVLTQNTPSTTAISISGTGAATVFGGTPVTAPPTISLNPGNTVGDLLTAVDLATGNTTNPSSVSATSGIVTLNSGTATNSSGIANGLAVTADGSGVFKSLGFTSGILPAATPTGGGQAGTGFVIGSDIDTFDNESISGGAITVYNSAGTPVNVQLRWAEIAPGTWNLFYQSNPTATGNQTAWTNVGQNFTFNSNGALTSPAGGGVTIAGLTVGGQQVGDVKLNFASGALSQFASTTGTATVGQITQNGFPAGQLQSVAINNSGLVVGTFSNGQNIDLAEITLSHFNGTNYLQSLDGEAYAATEQSGAAIQGASGSISGSSLEGSNTDIADEFTKLIVTQQAYSANTKVITTANDMVQSLLNVLR